MLKMPCVYNSKCCCISLLCGKGNPVVCLVVCCSMLWCWGCPCACSTPYQLHEVDADVLKLVVEVSNACKGADRTVCSTAAAVLMQPARAFVTQTSFQFLVCASMSVNGPQAKLLTMHDMVDQWRCIAIMQHCMVAKDWR